MATLSYSSTLDDVYAEYDNNASYEEDGSQTKCKAFITAVIILIRRRPQMTLREQMQLSFELLHPQLIEARRWLAANPGSTRRTTRYGDLRNFRDSC